MLQWTILLERSLKKVSATEKAGGTSPRLFAWAEDWYDDDAFISYCVFY